MEYRRNGGWASINGKICRFEQAQIPAHDRGFLYGDQMIETMLGIDGRIVSLNDHLHRLWVSVKAVNCVPGVSLSILRRECIEVYKQLSHQGKAMIRVMITRGGGVGLFAPCDQTAYRYIFVWPMDDRPPYALKCNLVIKDHLDSYKTGYYLPAVTHLLRSRHMHQSTDGLNSLHESDLIWMSPTQQILESSTANIFFVQSERLITPSHDHIFSGLTAKKVMRIAMDLGFKVKTQPVFCQELNDFSECFLTSSVRGLVPVEQVGTHTFEIGPSSVFSQINHAYQKDLS